MEMADAAFLAWIKKWPLVLTLALSLLPSALFAAEEMTNTSRVKVGDKAPITDSLQGPIEETQFIVLVLFPSPIGCDACAMVRAAMDETEKKHPDIAFFRFGGEPVEGALNDESIVAKKKYGFVAAGEPWTFFIDGEGKIRMMTKGGYNGFELQQRLIDIILGKKFEKPKEEKKPAEKKEKKK